MKEVNNMDEWLDLSAILQKLGYRLWQFQYSYDDPEGFQASFWLTGVPNFKIVTHDKAIQEAIIKYPSETNSRRF